MDNAEGGAPQDPAVTLTVAQVDAQINAQHPRRPRRAASEGVTAAVRAQESAQARRAREERERQEAEEAAAAAAEDAAREAARLEALEKASDESSKNPPLDKDSWYAQLFTGLLPAIQYIFSRTNEGGDRFDSMEVFRGSMIMNPAKAKTLNRNEAYALINKLRKYPIFNVDNGNGTVIERLKDAWDLYKMNADEVSATFDKDGKGDVDKNAITTWHYRLNLRADTEKVEDASCRYCTNNKRGCDCYDKVKVWWEACELLALVLPSSGTSERVFSFASNLWDCKQHRLLADALRLSLFLAFNKRC